MDRSELKKQLNRQLSFLSRSCESYDSGYEDEAIRIAVIIRVLLHNTTRSTSLLSLLNSEDISLLSTCPISDGSNILISGGLSWAQIEVKEGKLAGAKHVPMLNSHKEDNIFLPVSDWWRQIIYSSPVGSITRKQIVLSAANKDGGAHVDPKLTPEYDALKNGRIGVIFNVSGPEYSASFVIEDVHLSDLRQMGHEILSSPDIYALAK